VRGRKPCARCAWRIQRRESVERRHRNEFERGALYTAWRTVVSFLSHDISMVEHEHSRNLAVLKNVRPMVMTSAGCSSDFNADSRTI
jgi:hypothetical protein